MPREDRLIKLAMTLAVIIVATVAAIISYRHAYEVAVQWGAEGRLNATILPLSVDGLIVSGSLTGLFCSRYGIDKPKLARTALLTGIAATLVTNVAHGISHGPAAAVIAGWPAVAFLVSSELLLWVVAASRTLAAKTIVTIDQAPEQTTDLSRVVELLGEVKEITAAEVGRKLGLRYPTALTLTKQARELLARSA